MAKLSWGWVGAAVCLVTACGGRAESGNHASAAGHAPVDDDDVRGDNGGAASSHLGGSSGSALSSAGAPAEAGDGGTGGDDTCRGTLADVSQALGFTCPAELCAGTVAASACDALPVGVNTTIEASCDDLDGHRFRTLTYEISGTKRKACHYDQADFEAPALLIGAEAWDDSTGACAAGGSHVSAGVTPAAHCEGASSDVLCGLGLELAVPSNTPPRACYDGFSGTCEPCCAATAPSCVGKEDGYPGYDCTPPLDQSTGEISYCSCGCEQGRWSCAC